MEARSGRDRSRTIRQVVDMFATMHIIRAFEVAAAEAWKAGYVRGSVHQSIGQEAIAVGVCSRLRRTDYITSNHRNHAHNIAKGANPKRMMFELFGRAEGTCGGKAGSLHIADFSLGILGANGVVGDGVSIGIGAAHSIKLLGQDRIVVPFFGDGAVNRGPVLEAMNWAMVYQMPVLFVCEDNRFAATTVTKNVTAGNFPTRAKAFGIVGEEVNGNDVLAVASAADKLIAKVREKQRPAYLYATTYRHMGHFAHDKAEYIDPIAHQAALKNDPLPTCATWLNDHGVEMAELDQIATKAKSDMAKAAADAAVAPWPDIAEAFAGVQTIGAPCDS
jgi:TPP-dependent pyruvate/acetoin dehydrogenase alpha subunit